jgi:hypothetical protein
MFIGENKYKIDLKTDTYNFYLVGNEFKEKFFIYYLQQHLKINQLIDYTHDKLTLKILDHNVNALTIEFTDKLESIVLEKNGYKILNNE